MINYSSRQHVDKCNYQNSHHYHDLPRNSRYAYYKSFMYLTLATCFGFPNCTEWRKWVVRAIAMTDSIQRQSLSSLSSLPQSRSGHPSFPSSKFPPLLSTLQSNREVKREYRPPFFSFFFRGNDLPINPLRNRIDFFLRSDERGSSTFFLLGKEVEVLGVNRRMNKEVK